LPQTIRILCVDDNPAVIEALRLKVSLEPDLAWAGHLESADHLQDEVERAHPDVVLLDVDMPGTDPFEALRAISDAYPDTRTLMFTAHAKGELVDRAVGAGAWGYLLKSEGATALVNAIRRVSLGEVVIQPQALLHMDGGLTEHD
jgi:two-component system, NarL family, response regulator DesR